VLLTREYKKMKRASDNLLNWIKSIAEYGQLNKLTSSPTQ
jgi:hypothetical protein